MATNTTIKGKNYYRIRKTIGHKPDGKPIIKNFYGSSKGDAEHQYALYLQEEARKKYEGEQAFAMATIHSRAKEYIENVLKVSSKYSPGTRRRYESVYNTHIKDTWLDKSLVKDVKASTVQTFYNELEVTMPTMEAVNKFMSAFYKWMALNDYANSILAAVILPEKEYTPQNDDIVVWEDKEIESILRHSDGHRLRFMFYLLNYTGMRISEALGLKYGDIYDDTVHIERQLFEGEIKLPKYKSNRKVPMHKELKKALEIHKAWHEEEMIKNKYKTDYVFTTSSGLPYNYGNIRRAAERYYKSIGIEWKKFHAYRATFCTNLCRKKVPIEVASKLLGHKSLEVTAAHYALVKKDKKLNAVNKLK